MVLSLQAYTASYTVGLNISWCEERQGPIRMPRYQLWLKVKTHHKVSILPDHRHLYLRPSRPSNTQNIRSGLRERDIHQMRTASLWTKSIQPRPFVVKNIEQVVGNDVVHIIHDRMGQEPNPFVDLWWSVSRGGVHFRSHQGWLRFKKRLSLFQKNEAVWSQR